MALSEETKNDLRRHHFQLGYHSVNDPSEYKREFLEKEKAKPDIDQNEMKAFLRKHNHDFGDHNQYYNTTYDLSHNKPYNK